jgi:holo-[acyl-carrier protein] synthase
MTPEGCGTRIDLTITDDFPHAQAIVIISAIPQGMNI